jgi:hypothetical protein
MFLLLVFSDILLQIALNSTKTSLFLNKIVCFCCQYFRYTSANCLFLKFIYIGMF